MTPTAGPDADERTVTQDERIAVDAGGARQRLDRYLAARGKWGSRSHVQRLISAGLVRLDGQLVKPGTVLAILYEDEWLLVIDKPPGLVVHPAPGHWRGTLVNALLHHWQGARSGLDPLRPGIVHRLDKDTSGVLVIAKDAATLADIGAQFRKREVEKQYLAFVWGRLRSQSGTITEPIGRNPVHRKRMAVRRTGRAAVTSFEVVERFPSATLVRLFPKTGRTHQIRVHLAAIGHPIVGDAVYGGTRKRQLRVPRQALHAERITFRHPRTGARVSFAAPLAEDLVGVRHLLKTLPAPRQISSKE
jgi:23S rRNA pseudouridine1911/1915/1917 synthase